MPESPKPNTCRSNAIQMHIFIPSSIPQSTCGTFYWMTSTSCRTTASKLTEHNPADKCLPTLLFYPLHSIIFLCWYCFAPVLPHHASGPIHLGMVLLSLRVGTWLSDEDKIRIKLMSDITYVRLQGLCIYQPELVSTPHLHQCTQEQ